MIHGVIMAGGSGARFWPQSRRNRPKQLLNIVGDRTMIRTTAERILPIIPFERIMVVTAQSHEAEIRNELRSWPLCLPLRDELLRSIRDHRVSRGGPLRREKVGHKGLLDGVC